MAIIEKHSETELKLTTTVEEVIQLDMYLEKKKQIVQRIANLKAETAKLQAILDTTTAQYDEARTLGVKLSSEVTPPDENPPG